MLELGYDYGGCVRSSEKVAWKLDDVLPPDMRIDFTRPFLPDVFTSVRDLRDLKDRESLALNHITAHAYMNLFAFVEEYIQAMAVNHAQAEMFGDPNAVRALVRFADEEIKHQQLFYRYLEQFRRDFGYVPGALGDAAAVAQVVLSKSAMAVLITTLHLEIMTQAHYTESVRTEEGLDPLFTSLLKNHWLEEAQHARIDALELDRIASGAEAEQIEQAVGEYLDLVDAIDGLLKAQADMDAVSFFAVTGHVLDDALRTRIIAAQHAAYRRTFLTSGMTNSTFRTYMSRLSETGARRIAKKVEALA
jgi:hypothetical protein